MILTFGAVQCPSDNRLAQLAAGLLSSEERAAVQDHLDACETCRTLVGELATLGVLDAPSPSWTAGVVEATTPAGLGAQPTIPVDDGIDAITLRAGTAVGRYMLVGKIGAGGMGVVHAAYDPDLDRGIALKFLLRAADGNDRGREERLHREARAMAKLSHPNVVTVYDVGTYRDRLFIAMELVDGTTMREWLGAGDRAWREVVRLFVDAGNGLAAAHDAGIVHRDFKPENVLITTDGVARVTDFGLASQAASPDKPGPRSGDDERDGAVDPTLRRSSGSATVPGTVLGTPSYMAPEQHRGDAADPRSDQYALCVAMYEGLYGARPFSAPSMADLAAAKEAGEVPASEDGRVPARLHRALVRGLSPRPEDRFPSVRALLDEVAATVAPPRRLWIPIAAAAALIIAGFWLARATGGSGTSPPDVCAAGASRAAEVWNDSVRDSLAGSFARTSRPYAAETAGLVADHLASFAGAWATSHRAICEATAVRGEQSEALLDVRMACMKDRLAELGALIALYRDADDELVDRAVSAALSLRPTESCEVLEGSDAVAPPGDAAARDEIARLEDELATARALVHAGKWKQARDALVALRDSALATGYAPLVAPVAVELAGVHSRLDDGEAADEAAREAIEWAALAHDDATHSRALTLLVYVLGRRAGKPDEALSLLGLAEAAATRAGDPLLRADYLANAAAVTSLVGDYEASRIAREESLAIQIEHRDADDPRLGIAHQSLCEGWRLVGRHAQAEAECREAVAILGRALGDGHPLRAAVRVSLASTLIEQGKLDKAHSELLEVLERLEAVYDDTHPHIRIALNNLGALMERMQRPAEGEVYERRVLELRKKSLPPGDPRIGTSYNGLGNTLTNLGKYSEAREMLEAARLIYEKTPKHIEYGITFVNLGTWHRAQDQHAEAEPLFRKALAIMEGAVGADHPRVFLPLYYLGQTLGATGRAREAIPLFERALGLEQIPPWQHADASWSLAEALIETGGDRDRANRLVADALAIFRERDMTGKLERLEAWAAKVGLQATEAD